MCKIFIFSLIFGISFGLMTFDKKNPVYKFHGLGSSTDQGVYNGNMKIGRPGARKDTHSWVFLNTLWIYGGEQISGHYDDVWQYTWTNAIGQQWLQFRGDAGATMTIPDPIDHNALNIPGNKYRGAYLHYNGDHVLFVSGYTRGLGYMNDVWDLDCSIQDWAAYYCEEPFTSNQVAYYVHKGAFSSQNHLPAVRYSALAKPDFSQPEILVYYGGWRSSDSIRGNDLWQYNVTHNQWGLFKGNPFSSVGVDANNDFPGAYNDIHHPLGREKHIMFTISQTEVMIFGGLCQDSTTTGQCNDGWYYDIALNQFKHVGGSITIPSTGSVITKEREYVSTNWPGAREQPSMIWLAGSANQEMLVLGGYGLGEGETTAGYLSDFWLYNINTNEWLYWGGYKTRNIGCRYASSWHNYYRLYNRIGGGTNRIMYWRGSGVSSVWVKELFIVFGSEYFGSSLQTRVNRHWQADLYLPNYCYGKWNNESDACTETPLRGTCVGTQSCECTPKYWDYDCHRHTCNYVHDNVLGPPNDHSVCTGHGDCLSVDNCQCDTTPNTGYFGQWCQYWRCFGFRQDNVSRCSGHGTCPSPETCNCNPSPRFYGTDCRYEQCDSTHWGDFDLWCRNFICFGIRDDDKDQCEGHGKCTGPNECTCDPGYYSYNCGYWKCFKRQMDNPAVCSGEGTCAEPDLCWCRSTNRGGDCSNSLEAFFLVLSITGVIVGLVIGFLLVLAGVAVGIYVFVRLQRKYKDKTVNWRTFEDEDGKTLTELAEDEFKESDDEETPKEKEEPVRGVRGARRVRRVRRVRRARGVRRVRRVRRVRGSSPRGAPRGRQNVNTEQKEVGSTAPSIRGNVQRRVMRGRRVRRRVSRGVRRPVRRPVRGRPVSGRPRGRPMRRVRRRPRGRPMRRRAPAIPNRV